MQSKQRSAWWFDIPRAWIRENYQQIKEHTEFFSHCINCQTRFCGQQVAGLGRVPDLRVRVQVRVLVICVSTSTWLLHESESEYWLMSTSTSTSTGLWSTFYIGSSFSFFGLWQGSPQILKNLGQSSNDPLSIYICLIILCNLIHWRFNVRIVTCWLSWLTFTTCCQLKNKHKQNNSDSVNFSMMIKLKESTMKFLITSHVSYIQIIAK